MPLSEADIKLIIQTQTGNTVGQLQSIAAQMQTIDQRTQRVGHSTNMLGTNMSKLWRSALYGVTSYLSVTAIMGGVSAIASAYKSIAESQTKFEKAITPLLALGDNLSNIPDIKTKVLGWANAFQMTNDQASNLLFTIQSVTANLSKGQRRGIESSTLLLGEVAGGDPVQNAKLLSTMIQNADASVTSARQAANIAFKAMELGNFTMQQASERFPEILALQSLTGASPVELLAMTASGSQSAGNFEKFTTGMRGLMLIMQNTTKMKTLGVNTDAPLLNILDQLRDKMATDREAFIKAFDREVVVSASQVLGKTEDIPKLIDALNAVKDNSKYLADKLGERFTDEDYSLSRVREMAKSMGENALVSPGTLPEVKRIATAGQVARSYFQANHPILSALPGMGWAAEIFGMADQKKVERAIKEGKSLDQLNGGDLGQVTNVAQRNQWWLDDLKRQGEIGEAEADALSRQVSPGRRIRARSAIRSQINYDASGSNTWWVGQAFAGGRDAQSAYVEPPINPTLDPSITKADITQVIVELRDSKSYSQRQIDILGELLNLVEARDKKANSTPPAVAANRNAGE